MNKIFSIALSVAVLFALVFANVVYADDGVTSKAMAISSGVVLRRVPVAVRNVRNRGMMILPSDILPSDIIMAEESAPVVVVNGIPFTPADKSEICKIRYNISGNPCP